MRARTLPRSHPRQTPRRGRLGTQSGRAAFLALGPSAWYDTRDLTTTSQQGLPNRVGTGAAQFGSTTGTDTNDPLALPGSGYVYLPGTSSNNLSIPKDGGWAGTLHITATLTDDTTTTFTTTADPILIGNTLIAAGRYKRFDVRDTDGTGTLRVTINPTIETLGQASWTCTTGQTVTVNRATTGLTTAVVTRPLLMLDGTDDYIQLPAGDTPTYTRAAGEHTAMVMFQTPVGVNGDRLLSLESSGTSGMLLYYAGSNAMGAIIRGGTSATSTVASGYVVNTLTVAGHIVDDGTHTVWTNHAGLGTPADFTGLSTDPVFGTPRIGLRSYDLAVATDSQVYAVVLFPRALTTDQLTTVASFLLGTYP